MTARSVLTAPALSVQPGSEVTTVLTVRNTGSVVDHFHIQVLGDAARWATATPDNAPPLPRCGRAGHHLVQTGARLRRSGRRHALLSEGGAFLHFTLKSGTMTTPFGTLTKI